MSARGRREGSQTLGGSRPRARTSSTPSANRPRSPRADPCSHADGPVLQVELGHREVLGVARGQPHASADAAHVTVSLCPNQGGRIRIPFVLTTCERPKTRFDVLPALVVLERSANGLGNEGAAASPSHAPV